MSVVGYEKLDTIETYQIQFGRSDRKQTSKVFNASESSVVHPQKKKKSFFMELLQSYHHQHYM